MKTTVVGFPRIGESRELKFITEQYFRKEITEDQLHQEGKKLREKHWQLLHNAGINSIPSNDFSFYDTTLDTAVLFNIIPTTVATLTLSDTEKYFALARGYQGPAGDVKALAMRKWFNTNYHYIVPEIHDQTDFKLVGDKLFNEYLEAKALGIETRPVIIGPYTLLRQARISGKKTLQEHAQALIPVYHALFNKLDVLDCQWLQIDEPALVLDLSPEQQHAFLTIWTQLLNTSKTVRVLLQTYFGDTRDIYQDMIKLPVDGLGLDFVEGRKTLELIKQHGFPTDKWLFAGVINGKNIWKNNYQHTLNLLNQLSHHKVVISTSCSLQHVPFSLKSEHKLTDHQKKYFAFATEKLGELNEIHHIMHSPSHHADLLAQNQTLFDGARIQSDEKLANQIAALTERDYHRDPQLETRKSIQKKQFNLPILPTTTIGSFPQTKDIKSSRSRYRKGELSAQDYHHFCQQKIAECIELQEKIGIDVLVHGEYERNDMVEYFGENLTGYVFTEAAWVQSYGTRCVKPPIIWSDIRRDKPITIDWAVYAQSLTPKPVKGMLTGPVTILNWSFPREDISLNEMTCQLALAIQEEVLELEANGINIIQIDEAALREKLPLRRTDWHSQYLDWAIPAFRLVHSKVKPETQIHTHMCYSEFSDIIDAIEDLDVDVISFEASRSNLSLLDVLKKTHFRPQVGPGVYDIHSPRVPSVKELHHVITQLIEKLPIEQIWINPDCGLKTRDVAEVIQSLTNMIKATQIIRESEHHESTLSISA